MLPQGREFFPETILQTVVQEGRAQIEPSVVTEWSIQSSEFGAKEEIGICGDEEEQGGQELYKEGQKSA